MATVGQYISPSPLVDNEGRPQTSRTVTVRTASGHPAPLYTDETGATLTGSNQVTTDSGGLVNFFAPLGDYVLTWTNGIGTTDPGSSVGAGVLYVVTATPL